MTPYKDELLHAIEKGTGEKVEVRRLSDEIEIAHWLGVEQRTESSDEELTPYRAILTLGMSAEPMEGAYNESWQRAELCWLVPRDMPLELSPENWPMWWLNYLALLPRRQNTRLGLLHTIPNGDPPQPFAPDTPFCGWLLISPVELERHFARLKMKDGEVINLLSPVPLYRDELIVKVNKGTGALLEMMVRARISDIFDPNRPSVFEKRKRKGLFRR